MPEQRFANVVLVDERGWILLQERDEHPVIDPEKWGFCGGHLEPGEEFEVAAHRELEEETGVRLPEGRLRLLGEFPVFHRHSGTTDPVQVFIAGADLTDADIDCREGRQIVFVDPERVRRGELDLTAAAAVVLPHLLASEEYAVLTPATHDVRLSCVVLVDARGWLLLQERDSFPRVDPDRWGFCGGHLEPGEDFEAGAYRELEEETGLRLAPGTLQRWYAEQEPVPLHLWIARADLTDEDIDCREGRQIVFVDPERVLRGDLDLGGLPARLLAPLLAGETYSAMTR